MSKLHMKQTIKDGELHRAFSIETNSVVSARHYYGIMRKRLDEILRYKREHTWQICKIPIEIVNAGKYWFNKPMKADLYIGEGIDCPEFGINGFGHSPEEIQKELQESVEDMAVLYYGFGYDDSKFTDGGALKRKWKEYLDLEKIEKELK